MHKHNLKQNYVWRILFHIAVFRYILHHRKFTIVVVIYYILSSCPLKNEINSQISRSPKVSKSASSVPSFKGLLRETQFQNSWIVHHYVLGTFVHGCSCYKKWISEPDATTLLITDQHLQEFQQHFIYYDLSMLLMIKSFELGLTINIHTKTPHTHADNGIIKIKTNQVKSEYVIYVRLSS